MENKLYWAAMLGSFTGMSLWSSCNTLAKIIKLHYERKKMTKAMKSLGDIFKQINLNNKPVVDKNMPTA